MDHSKIQLICSDIDGTLLDASRNISAATIAIIQELQLPFILASSRMPSAMRYLQKQLGIDGAPLIAYNGGLILGENNTVLQSNTFDRTVLAEIIDHQRQHSYNISTFCEDIWHTAEHDFWTAREINNTRVNPNIISNTTVMQEIIDQEQLPHKIMCMGTAEELDSLVAVLSTGKEEHAHLYRSKDTYLEITAKHTDKAKALRFLLEAQYHITMENVIAFGDNHNDDELLKQAGTGVAVANATDKLKAIANFVSPYTHKEDAVAKTLQHFFSK